MSNTEHHDSAHTVADLLTSLLDGLLKPEPGSDAEPSQSGSPEDHEEVVAH